MPECIKQRSMCEHQRKETIHRAKRMGNIKEKTFYCRDLDMWCWCKKKESEESG